MAPRIELITHPDRFGEIKPHWDALWQRCGAHVFQTHAWIEGWLRASNGYAAPRVAVSWHGGEILAAFPLAVRRRFGFRTLEWSAQTLSDYCDALATPETASQLPVLWEAVCEAGGFTLVNLAQVSTGAVVQPFLDGERTSRTRIVRRDRQERCLGIDCHRRDGEAWFRSLGKKARNNFWRGERILTEAGGDVAYHCLDPLEGTIEAELRRAMALKREWLRTTDPASPLLGRDGDALEAMLSAAAGAGLIRLFMLSCGDRMAAASVNFVHADQMQAYMTCYDPAFSRASPGMILMVRYIRWAFDNGMTKVDFLRGEEPFKSHLANCEISLNTYTGARTVVGRAAVAAHRWRSGLRGRRPPARAAGAGVSGPGALGTPSLAGGH
jgi:CelD/BcsL family acetyltransferase involved in cellulose biosynthesis